MAGNDLLKALSGLIPQDPQAGPPLPKGLKIGWPVMFANILVGGVDRLQKEGPFGLVKSIQKEGLAGELKKEIKWASGKYD